MLCAVTRVQVVVEGLSYSTDFNQAAAHPIKLSLPSQLVYSPHDYSWSQPVASYEQFARELDVRWGAAVNGSAVWLGDYPSMPRMLLHATYLVTR